MAHVADEEKLNEQQSENGTESATDESTQAETERPLPPLIRSVIDAVKREYPSLDPQARDDDWVEVYVDREQWHDVALGLRDKLGFDYLSLLSGVDYQENGFQVVYHLIAIDSNKKIVVKVNAPERDEPTVPSIMDVWPTANFHEREAWDMFGIRFSGHPDLRRILMREDWEGHPLRKDYVDDRVPRERQTRETYAEAQSLLNRQRSEGINH